MSRQRGLYLLPPLALLALSGSLGACTSDLALNLSGKQCDSHRECVDGYVCNTSNVCVRPAELLVDGGGIGPGPGGSAGQGGSGAGSGGAPANPGGTGGSAGRGGTGGIAASGGAGGLIPDPGDGGVEPPPDPPDGGCNSRIYRDSDGDGVGDPNDFITGCPAPGWVLQSGDCRDDRDDVFPGQTEFFSTPFPAMGQPGGISFDYDCSLTEEADPANDTLDPVPACNNILACGGSGFLPFSPPRNGANIEPRCGSNIRRDCVTPVVTSCSAEDTLVDPSVAFRCK